MKAVLQKHRVALAVSVAVLVAAVGIVVAFNMEAAGQLSFLEAPLDALTVDLAIIGWSLLLLILGLRRTGAARTRACIAAVTTVFLSNLFLQADTVTLKVLVYMAACVAGISLLGLSQFPGRPHDRSDRP